MARPAQPDEIKGSFAFLAAACRWPDDAARRAGIAQAAARVEDWAMVVEDGRRHRVMPMLARALHHAGGCPAPLVERATAMARRDTVAAMAQAGEAVRIGTALSAAGVDWIVVKGPALALLAYGDIAAKAAHDLDLLIAPDARAAAFAAMRALGYRSIDGQDRATPGTLDHVLKDSGWQHPEKRVMVELHSRLFANRALVPAIGLSSPREAVAFGGGLTLPTLARPDLIVYLAVHGANTNWHRLKWIADFNALARATSAADLASAARLAQALGAGDVLDSALALSARLFGESALPPPASLSRQARRLGRAGMRDLTAPHEATLREVDWDRQAVVYLDKLRFMPGWAYRREELRLMIVEASSYHPDARWWHRWTAPVALLGRFLGRKAGQMLGRAGAGRAGR